MDVSPKTIRQYRLESDSLGEVRVPANALYGVQTQRAIDNFPITGVRISHYPEFVKALAAIKKASAMANERMGMLDAPRAKAIREACAMLMAGKHRGHFRVDVIQGGAGTSSNMNANEVIANLALEIMGHTRGDYAFLHPNNHVNLSQSTNDVYPSAIRLTLVIMGQALPFQQEQMLRGYMQYLWEKMPIKIVNKEVLGPVGLPEGMATTDKS